MFVDWPGGQVIAQEKSPDEPGFFSGFLNRSNGSKLEFGAQKRIALKSPFFVDY
ncbi:hypothetical protein X739_07430 [Mesorhizobium sp. LNHC220B00]|nr:hypothetical protein X739_07430 [Mesorhizobium sp. LNHC220B00]